ncbi:MAG: hypothetical protein QOE79_1924 [Sphingomonadales bacterium]|jgi:hypothetical protein|nr:hypothetical protein [Sphingomonadales bacterium]
MRRAAILLISTLAAAAAARSPSGIGVNGTDAMRSAYSGPKTLPRIYQLGRCIAERAATASEKLLASIPESRGEAGIVYGPIGGRLAQCAGSGVEVTNALLRGAIAQALYDRRYAGIAPPPAPIAVPPIDWSGNNPAAASLAPVYDLGRCAVATDPPAVRRLAATQPSSAAEGAVLGELMPKLKPCLDRGITFTTNRETLRAILIESLYKWSLAQRPGTALAGAAGRRN